MNYYKKSWPFPIDTGTVGETIDGKSNLSEESFLQGRCRITTEIFVDDCVASG